jgi:hypothetical protein
VSQMKVGGVHTINISFNYYFDISVKWKQINDTIEHRQAKQCVEITFHSHSCNKDSLVCCFRNYLRGYVVNGACIESTLQHCCVGHVPPSCRMLHDETSAALKLYEM